MDIDKVKKWIDAEEPKLEYGEIHVVISKHQGVVSEIKTAIVEKKVLEKKRK